MPSRLLALKYGADLVWGPEIVDRAMIDCERIVDSTYCDLAWEWVSDLHKFCLCVDETGVISFEKAGKPVWTTHPIEKPFLIYQIGSANPEMAVQAALMVMNDVSGNNLMVFRQFDRKLISMWQVWS